MTGPIFDTGGRPTLRPGERSEPVTVLLPVSEVAALRREAAARGLALSALIRERLALAALSLDHDSAATLDAAVACTLCDGTRTRGDGPCRRCNGWGLLYARPA